MLELSLEVLMIQIPVFQNLQIFLDFSMGVLKASENLPFLLIKIAQFFDALFGPYKRLVKLLGFLVLLKTLDFLLVANRGAVREVQKRVDLGKTVQLLLFSQTFVILEILLDFLPACQAVFQKLQTSLQIKLDGLFVLQQVQNDRFFAQIDFWLVLLQIEVKSMEKPRNVFVFVAVVLLYVRVDNIRVEEELG